VLRCSHPTGGAADGDGVHPVVGLEALLVVVGVWLPRSLLGLRKAVRFQVSSSAIGVASRGALVAAMNS
jgi:hypothetical protein